jgi:acylphosphatase
MNTVPQTICHVLIQGRVQRVGYRAWTEDTARAHGLEGWVRNRLDGTVEAVFAGPTAVVGAMIEACRHGPRAAQVDSIEQRQGSANDLALRHPGELFSVLRTE